VKDLRVAVVGVGHLGRHHARILAGMDGVTLVGVADPVPDTRDALAAAHGCRAVADYAELTDQIDLAVVATPTRSHHRVGLDLLQRGIGLLIEKPIASNAQEAAELVAAAESAGVVLQVGHIERFNPAFVSARPHTTAPKYIEASRLSGFTFRSTDVGVVLDLMIHDIDLVLAMAGTDVVDIAAVGVSVFGGEEDIATARLTFAGGTVANLTASRASTTARRTMQVWTDRGVVDLDFGERTARVVRPDAALLERTFDVGSLTPQEVDHFKNQWFEELFTAETLGGGNVDQLTAELEDFVDSAQRSRHPRVTGQQGRAALIVAERVLESIARHQWDGSEKGRVGSRAAGVPAVIPTPHWDHLLRPAAEDSTRRAG
jgi:predicted dehydrogenase